MNYNAARAIELLSVLIEALRQIRRADGMLTSEAGKMADALAKLLDVDVSASEWLDVLDVCGVPGMLERRVRRGGSAEEMRLALHGHDVCAELVATLREQG